MRNKIPKILIIGGAGYIGRQIVNLLTKQKKYEICVLDNLSTTKKNYLAFLILAYNFLKPD